MLYLNDIIPMLFYLKDTIKVQQERFNPVIFLNLYFMNMNIAMKETKSKTRLTTE